ALDKMAAKTLSASSNEGFIEKPDDAIKDASDARLDEPEPTVAREREEQSADNRETSPGTPVTRDVHEAKQEEPAIAESGKKGKKMRGISAFETATPMPTTTILTTFVDPTAHSNKPTVDTVSVEPTGEVA